MSSLKTVMDSLDVKGAPLINIVQECTSMINRIEAHYIPMRKAAGVPLTDMTDVQINDYYGFELPVDVLASTRKILNLEEKVMTDIKDLVSLLDPNDIG